MNPRSLSRLCGILFLFTVAAFLVGNMVLKNPFHDTERYANTFQRVSENASRYRLGNFVAFVGLIAQFALAITLYQILKTANPFLALLALGWRIGEQVLLTPGILAGFLILGLSQDPASLGGGVAEWNALAQILVSAPIFAEDMAYVFLGIASVFNNWLFYSSRVIPSWLALLGIVGAVLYALGRALPMVVALPAAIEILLFPLLIFELILGFYLVIWGLKHTSAP